MESKLRSTTDGGPSEAVARGRRLLADSPRAAAEQARAILALAPHDAAALRLLGAALRQLDAPDDALAVEAQAIRAARHDPRLVAAGAALVDNDLAAAEPLLRDRLRRDPFDVPAIRMMAELAARVGRPADSESLLRRAIELSPGFDAARANLATLLYRQQRSAEALALLDEMQSGEASDAHDNLRAAALGRLGAFEEAIAIYRDVLDRHPRQAKLWMSLAHLLRTVGEQDEAIAAYRHAITLSPAMGEVWWSLANLKTVAFSSDDIAAMTAALDDSALGADDALHLHFALGKALEDRGEDERAWAHYESGNRLRADQLNYQPGRIGALVDRSIAATTAEFFADRLGSGCTAPDPIFILGMPRAGSTLIEQILSSHSRIEGTMELPDLIAIVRASEEQGRPYPAALADLDGDALTAMGQDYINRTRVQRQSDKPQFIDKMPNNWAYVGLIRLILPNARIIDARRHPMACGFSNFKQHYARGQAFSYDLGHFGAYYADYVRLMRHMDVVQPGTIHRVIHEQLVEDPEHEVRALLDYLGLEFEPPCLRFHENKRPVRTASSEQVRRPIRRDGLDQWRRFEKWLEPLEQALGSARHSWNDAPPP